jgi:hypothetical protein
MKYFLLAFTFTLALILVEKISCEKKSECATYKCSSKVLSNQCLKGTLDISSNATTIEYSLCRDGYSCKVQDMNFNEKGEFLASCEPYTRKDLPAGEICLENSDCTDNNCLNGVCKFSSDRSSCKRHAECDIGQACINSLCVKQKAIGESCKDDYQCVNSAGCLNEKCVKYNSLDLGSESDYAQFCKSGEIITIESKAYCENTKVISEKCSKEDEDSCTYLKEYSKKTIEDECKCKSFVDDKSRICEYVEKSFAKTYDNRHTLTRFGGFINTFEIPSYLSDCFGESILSKQGWNALKNDYSFSNFIKINLFTLVSCALLF